MSEYSQIVEMPLEVVWKHFLYKIEHPEHFVPGVTHVIIREKTEEYVIRAMTLQSPDGSKMEVLEKITHKPYQVKYSILENPLFTGYVDNIAEASSPTETKITFSMHWNYKVDGSAFENLQMLQKAVMKTCEYILNQA